MTRTLILAKEHDSSVRQMMRVTIFLILRRVPRRPRARTLLQTRCHHGLFHPLNPALVVVRLIGGRNGHLVWKIPCTVVDGNGGESKAKENIIATERKGNIPLVLPRHNR